MSYDYSFPESLRIADFNNNVKVGSLPRKYIQSGNNVASGFARPAPFEYGSPAMGGKMGARKLAKGTSSGVKMLATDPVGFTKVLVGPPTTSSNFQGDPDKPFGGKIKYGKIAKSVGKVAVPIVTKVATKALEKAILDMMKSSAEAEGAGMSGGKKGAKAFAKSVLSSPITKAVAKEALDVALPIVKKIAMDMLKDGLKSMMEGSAEPAGGKKGSKGAKDFFRGVGEKTTDAGLAVGTAVGTKYLLDALANPAVDEGIMEALPVAEAVGLTVAEGAGMKRGRGRPRKIPIYGASPPMRSMSASGGQMIYGANPITRPMRGGKVRQRKVTGVRDANRDFIEASGGQMIYGADPKTYTPRKIGGGNGANSGGARHGMSRQMMVSKIMKERGVSLPMASSIVKKEGLY